MSTGIQASGQHLTAKFRPKGSQLRHAFVTALLLSSSLSWVLEAKLAFTLEAATSCAVEAATSLDATMSCSGLLRPLITPSAAFGPAVVLLVELRLAHAGTTALLYNLLLRCSSGFDKLSDGISDSDSSFENGVVDLELVGAVLISWLVHKLVEALSCCIDGLGSVCHFTINQLANVARLVGKLRLGRKSIGKLAELILQTIQAVGHDSTEEVNAAGCRSSRRIDKLVGLLIIACKPGQTFRVRQNIRNGIGECVDRPDDLRLIAVRSICNETVECRAELHGVTLCLFNLREHVRVNDGIDTLHIVQQHNVNLLVHRFISLAAVLAQLIELEQRLVHSGLVDLNFFLFFL
ncbi:SLA2 Src like adaptor 2 [Hortaea werneckii]|nr:SLA2 Src like adaptor 2 [Hortaea werneckii]